MEFLGHISEWFGGGVLAVLSFIVFGLGFAAIGLADEFGGAKKLLIGMLIFAIVVGLFFVCLGTGIYIAKALDIPGIIGIAAGMAAFFCLAKIVDHLLKQRRNSDRQSHADR